ncbi:MAG: Cthe_2314 family HEPN domain-containing protein [Phycisphaerae bacterium]|nr:Cthe_2314 family HEPN domain-containing protein [Phycisphaerae bacterium]
MNTKNQIKEYSTYNALVNHPFALSALHYGARIKFTIEKPHSLLKAEAKLKRSPSKAEYYCLSVASSLAHILTICQQLEHSVLYFSSFSPTPKMKKAGIAKQNHLLYCIENYIVRTQSMYDRLLKLIDCVFELYNPSHRICHDLIMNNSHVQHSSIPNKLRKLRKSIKDYYYERNVIIHERQFLEDNIRKLEAYTILSTSKGPLKGQRWLIEDIKDLARQIVKNKTEEFSKVNRNSFIILGDIFDHLNKEYKNKRDILESIYGKPELSEIPKM